MPLSESSATLAEWMASVQAGVESSLNALLPPGNEAPSALHEAMRYAVLEGGKRVRPLLVYAAGALGEPPPKRLAHAAAAVEMIHAYSLVHDDLPAMDNDVLRRGKPTVHVKYGEATGLLVGDALQSLAFEVLAESGAPGHLSVAMLAILARASGSRGMAGGQAIDLQSVGVALSQIELEKMHRAKTGALLSASVTLGALCAEVSDPQAVSALDGYSSAIGLAFQVVDDILDVEGDSAALGKTAGKDAAQNKPTYVSILGLNEARAFAETLRERAIASLAPFGARATRLSQLADFIVLRRS
jgi:farnesyl diphosphate synthase